MELDFNVFPRLLQEELRNAAGAGNKHGTEDIYLRAVRRYLNDDTYRWKEGERSQVKAMFYLYLYSVPIERHTPTEHDLTLTPKELRHCKQIANRLHTPVDIDHAELEKRVFSSLAKKDGKLRELIDKVVIGPPTSK